MKRLFAVFVSAAFALSLMAHAQAPQTPKPGPEVKKLDYFLGTWDMEGNTKPGPFGPGGKFTGMERNDWMPGDFFLVTHSQFKDPSGDWKGLAIMGYNADDKVYTYHEFNSMGEATSATGTVTGDTWIWLSEDKMGGKIMKWRFAVKVLSPTSYTFKFDLASPTGEWNTLMEGKATKEK